MATADVGALRCKAEISCFKIKGEDYHYVNPAGQLCALVDGEPAACAVGLFAVFDGHGGRRAADFASKQLPKRLMANVQDALQGAVDAADSEPYRPPSNADAAAYARWRLEDAVARLAPEALRSVFQETHDAFLATGQVSGTTATVALAVGSELIVANVGDSLAFVDTGAATVPVSGNHRIDENRSERQRLLDAGGEVAQASVEGEALGPLRIWPGGLAFSRSLGDAHAGPIVLADPTVRRLTLDHARGARLLLASDGVWDVVGTSATALAKRVRGMPATKAASNVRSYCKDKRDRDDISVIVVDFLPAGSEARLPRALADATAAPSAACAASRSSSCATVGGHSAGPLDQARYSAMLKVMNVVEGVQVQRLSRWPLLCAVCGVFGGRRCAAAAVSSAWDPVEHPEKWDNIWSGKMAARSAMLEAHAAALAAAAAEAERLAALTAEAEAKAAADAAAEAAAVEAAAEAAATPADSEVSDCPDGSEQASQAPDVDVDFNELGTPGAVAPEHVSDAQREDASGLAPAATLRGPRQPRSLVDPAALHAQVAALGLGVAGSSAPGAGPESRVWHEPKGAQDADPDGEWQAASRGRGRGQGPLRQGGRGGGRLGRLAGSRTPAYAHGGQAADADARGAAAPCGGRRGGGRGAFRDSGVEGKVGRGRGPSRPHVRAEGAGPLGMRAEVEIATAGAARGGAGGAGPRGKRSARGQGPRLSRPPRSAGPPAGNAECSEMCSAAVNAA